MIPVDNGDNENDHDNHSHARFNWGFPEIEVPPNHPIEVGFSSINHPFRETPI